MKKYLRKLILLFINFLSKININLTILLSTLISTLLFKRKISANFDGEDWIYKWNKSTVVTVVVCDGSNVEHDGPNNATTR